MQRSVERGESRQRRRRARSRWGRKRRTPPTPARARLRTRADTRGVREDTRPPGEARRSSRRATKNIDPRRRAHSDDVDGGGAMGAGAGGDGHGRGHREEPIGRGALEPLRAARIRLLRRRLFHRRERRPTNGSVVRDAERPRPRGGALVPARVRASDGGVHGGTLRRGRIRRRRAPPLAVRDAPTRAPSRTCTVASLTPAATEIVHALGLQSRLVCVTDRCDYPTTVARSFPIVLRSRLGVANDANRRRMGGRRDSISTAMHAEARAGAPATRPRGTSTLPSARPSASGRGVEGFGRDWC